MYAPAHDVEDLEQYRIGGYHPTIIGDAFHDGRYEIINKLGFGGYSSIWLARDHHQEHYVSLKILAASQSAQCNEAKILRLLSGSGGGSDNNPDSGPGHLGRQFIPRLLEDFTFDGPNGRHLCLVQGVAARSITVAKEGCPNDMFPFKPPAPSRPTSSSGLHTSTPRVYVMKVRNRRLYTP